MTLILGNRIGPRRPEVAHAYPGASLTDHYASESTCDNDSCHALDACANARSASSPHKLFRGLDGTPTARKGLMRELPSMEMRT
jgi:hypothetical protein